MTEPFDPEGFAQRQLDAYNAKDLERFVAEFTDDVVVFRLPDPEPVLVGKTAFTESYRSGPFSRPEIQAEVVNRMVFGNKVIDHERVVGMGDDVVEVAAVYEVTPGGIARIWFVRGV